MDLRLWLGATGLFVVVSRVGFRSTWPCPLCSRAITNQNNLALLDRCSPHRFWLSCKTHPAKALHRAEPQPDQAKLFSCTQICTSRVTSNFKETVQIAHYPLKFGGLYSLNRSLLLPLMLMSYVLLSTVLEGCTLVNVQERQACREIINWLHTVHAQA